MKRVLFTFAALLIGSVTCLTAHANTWNGTGNWTDVGNWSGGVPGAGDNAEIASGTCTISASTTIADLTVDLGATLSFTSWSTKITANNVTVDGIVTHVANSDNNGADGWQPDARVQLDCAALTVHGTGKIHGNSAGYGYDSVSHSGYGPGGGVYVSGSDYGTGAGHGAAGVSLAQTGAAFPPIEGGGGSYGVTNAPVEPGSGGGGRGTQNGGPGGGAILITSSGTVKVDGSISANGGDFSGGGDRASGGSGGSIFITCAALAGSGTIAADGGKGGGSSTFVAVGSGLGSGGAGGRIAIAYNQAAQTAQNVSAKPTVVFSAKGGTGHQMGNPGTLYFSGALVLNETAKGGYYVINGMNSWSPNSLSVTDGMLRFPQGFTLDVQTDLSLTTLGGLRMYGSTLNVGGNVTVNNGGIRFEGGTSTVAQVSIGGNCTMAVNSAAYFAALFTNGVPPNFGTEVNVGGLLSLAGACRIFPNSDGHNGASVKFALGALTLDSGAYFDADGRGFHGGDPGWYGSGGGHRAPTGLQGGGGGAHGGAGGDATAGDAGPNVPGTGGIAYDDRKDPEQPGSGGGGGVSSTTYPGDGGGVIHLTVSGTATINGTLTAKGLGASYDRYGAGAGGTINLRCFTLAGATGLLLASGGNGGSFVGGGGGGGLIAVRYQSNITNPNAETAWANSVAGGNGSNRAQHTGPPSPGQNGFITFFPPSKGTIVTIM